MDPTIVKETHLNNITLQGSCVIKESFDYFIGTFFFKIRIQNLTNLLNHCKQ